MVLGLGRGYKQARRNTPHTSWLTKRCNVKSTGVDRWQSIQSSLPRSCHLHVAALSMNLAFADLEKGLWSGNTTDTEEPSIHAEFVIGMVKGEPGRWALKYGDAHNRSGAGLTKWYEGVRPSDKTAGKNLPGGGDYSPMKKGGAVILGVGGDNSDRAFGWFLEGAM